MTRIINKRVNEAAQRKKLKQMKESADDDVKKCHECKACKCTFSTESSLAIHCKIHNGKPYRCRVCGDYFTHNKVLEKHMRSHVEKKVHTCPECDKQFGTVANLKMHLNIHTGAKPYKCTEVACGAVFPNVSALKNHVATIHKENRKEVLPKCEVLTPSSSPTCSLTAKKMHSCPICNKTYISKLSLEFHITHHIGSKPFVCANTGCQAEFEDEATLKSHSLTVHSRKSSTVHKKKTSTGNTNKPSTVHSGMPHTVKLTPGQRFQKFKTMQMQKHTKRGVYRCPECSKEFLGSGNLQIHMNRHLGLKPFKCKLGWCSASFADAGTLRRHKLTVHRGNIPFKCGDCTAGFKREICLQEHIKKFHGIANSKQYKSKAVLKKKASSINIQVTCDYCKAKFYNRGFMLRHIRLSHGNEKLGTSYTSEAAVQIKERKKNSDARKNVIYSCEQCHVTFKRRGILQNHVKRVHSVNSPNRHSSSSKLVRKQETNEPGCAQVDTFKCTQCKAEFKKEGFLRNHVEHNHSKALQQPKVETRGRPSKSSLKCEQCGLEFKHKRDLIDHNKRTHKKQLKAKASSNLSKQLGKPQSQGKVMDGVKKEMLKCKQCKAEFKDKMNLLSHIRCSHGTMRPRKHTPKVLRKESGSLQNTVSGILSDKNVAFKCEQCSFEFKYQVDLLKHVRSIHSSDMVVKLPDKTAVVNTLLRQSHFIEASFKCELCSAKFRLRHKLTKHVKIAHRRKQYKCDKCDLSFKRKSLFQKHTCVFGSEEVFLYKCEQCTDEFRQCRELLEHVRQHTDDIFDTCEEINLMSGEAVLPNYSDFVDNTVKQEYQHECGKCGDLFVDRKSLHSHLLIHAAERG